MATGGTVSKSQGVAERARKLMAAERISKTNNTEEVRYKIAFGSLLHAVAAVALALRLLASLLDSVRLLRVQRASSKPRTSATGQRLVSGQRRASVTGHRRPSFIGSQPGAHTEDAVAPVGSEHGAPVSSRRASSILKSFSVKRTPSASLLQSVTKQVLLALRARHSGDKAALGFA